MYVCDHFISGQPLLDRHTWNNFSLPEQNVPSVVEVLRRCDDLRLLMVMKLEMIWIDLICRAPRVSKESAPKILTVIVRPRLLTITCGDSSSKPVISLDDHHCSMSRGPSLTYRHIFLINHRQFFSHCVLPRGCQPCGAKNIYESTG